MSFVALDNFASQTSISLLNNSSGGVGLRAQGGFAPLNTLRALFRAPVLGRAY